MSTDRHGIIPAMAFQFLFQSLRWALLQVRLSVWRPYRRESLPGLRVGQVVCEGAVAGIEPTVICGAGCSDALARMVLPFKFLGLFSCRFAPMRVEDVAELTFGDVFTAIESIEPLATAFRLARSIFPPSAHLERSIALVESTMAAASEAFVQTLSTLPLTARICS